jgi:chromosome segregation ATPase
VRRQAAHAFRDSDFATTLQHAVQSLHGSSEQLTASTNGLSARLVDVRDGLHSTQNEWQLLAKVAERELETCRRASQEIHNEIQTLQQAGISLDQGTQATREASKQLRETRLEVMRDRKLAIEIAEAVQNRLTVDASAAESCRVFASALETALTNWNRNVERLDSLTTAFVTSVQQAKLESDDVLAERSQLARLSIEQLGQQLQDDLAIAIQRQQAALSQLGEPMLSAKSISQDLLQQLYALQSRVAAISALEPQNGNSAEGGR